MARGGDALAGLSPTQAAIVAGLGLGLTYRQLGAAFGLTMNGVRNHVRAAYVRLGTGSKVVAALRLRAAMRREVTPRRS